ncbi:hypothetical protein ID007_004309 [Salmonella enterica]|nr:hypothetical protein [Salmonella enterica]
METITSEDFMKLLGTYKQTTRKNDKHYPCKINGSWDKQQCEEYAELLMLDALSNINQELVAVNANTSKLMRSFVATLERHEHFMRGITGLIGNPKKLEHAMYIEYEFLRDDRARMLNIIDGIRKQAKEQLALTKSFPDDWGRAAYADSIGDLLTHLHDLQAHIYQLGQPILFNCYTKTARSAFKHYYDKWQRFTMQEKGLELESIQAIVKACQRQNLDYNELADEYAESRNILFDLNRDLKRRKRELKRAYYDRVHSGEYALRSCPPELSGNYYGYVTANEDGSYNITIPAVLGEAMKLAHGMNVMTNYTGTRIVVKHKSDTVLDPELPE